MKTYDERMAAVQRKLQTKRTRRKVLAATAGALCLCIVIGIFLPHVGREPGSIPNLDQHENSEYIDVIRALSDYDARHQEPEQSWFDELVNWGFSGSDLKGEEPPSVDMAPDEAAIGSSSSNASVEITDHQVAGVLEADVIKRSQTHIFYLKGNTLEVYPIAGAETKLLSTWVLKSSKSFYYNDVEMYLSEDASRLILVASFYGVLQEGGKKAAYVQVISLDVSDPADVKEENSCYMSGSLLSSRMVGEQMLLMTNYRISSDVDFGNASTFVPQIGTLEQMGCVRADGIVIPEELSSKQYTAVALLNTKDASLIDSGAFLSYSTQLYVSAGNIYATRSYAKVSDEEELKSFSRSMTEISCMSYGPEGLENKGTFQVEGTVKNQYSMDEYNGIFRIVTTTNVAQQVYGGGETIALTGRPTTNANLTCYRVGTWEQAAQVERFAPDGETVESVRFDGDYAYVCTAITATLSDPVFFFDMTDLDHITVKDTGIIEGYSSSLIQLSDGFLLGIGFNDNRRLKVEVYQETETGVESVCEYVPNAYFATEYKAYYIDRENNLFGIPTTNGYVLLQFDSYQLRELHTVDVIGDLNRIRGVIVDDFLYVFGESFAAAQLW